MKQNITQTFDGTHAVTVIEHTGPPCNCAGLTVALIVVAAWLAVLTFTRR